MKRILLANKFYYNRGGDCIASIALENLLKQKGHPVAFFSMHHPLNFKSEWDKYFLDNIDFSGDIKQKEKALFRMFYSQEVKKKFNRLIDDFKPDILHLNNIHSYISPYIGEIAHKKGIKVVWTMHDHKLICPTYLCLRNGKPCDLCIKKNLFHVVSKKCMKDNLIASILAYLEALVWNKNKLIRNTDIFICPSKYLKSRMLESGFPKDKLFALPHFNNRTALSFSKEKDSYYCYFGRLSQEKGIKTLIEAAKELPYELYVIGNGPLNKLSEQKYSNIHFLGFKEWDEMKNIINKAKFTVVPSECYEILGLSSIESLCLGTPVLGANIGGIPETINIPKDGLLFTSHSKTDLKEKIKLMFQSDFNYTEISRNAQNRFSADNYYQKLIKLYE